jgi:hypothetical protein
LFRSEKPLADAKKKAVRDRVRVSFLRLNLIKSGSDELQNEGERIQPRPLARLFFRARPPSICITRFVFLT